MCRVAAGPIVWIWPEPAPAEGSEAMSATAVLPPRIIPARPRVLKPPRKRPPQRETPRPEPRETAQERVQEIYQAHAKVLLRVFVGWTNGDRQAAEDVLQETMV